MERRISVSSFQPPNFENKQYLDDAVKIAEEIVEVMRADGETRFKGCSGYEARVVCVSQDRKTVAIRCMGYHSQLSLPPTKFRKNIQTKTKKGTVFLIEER